MNWVFNVYPALRPCLTSFYRKITGKTFSHQYVHLNNDVRRDFRWALDTLTRLPPVLLLESLLWLPSDATLIAYCDAYPKGLGFWFPSTNLAFYSAAPHDTQHIIFYLEALCVLSALEFCCQRLPPRSKLILYTDSHNTVDIFSSLRCLPAFNQILQASITLRTVADIDVRILHVPERDNEVADALSRADFNRALTVCPNLILNFFTPFHLETPSFSNPLQPPQNQLGAIEK